MSSIAVVGAGYVGIGTALALATKGNRVTLTDVNQEKLEAIGKGRALFFEPGVNRQMAVQVRRKRLFASKDTAAAVRGSDTVFICVGTPSAPDGSLDTSQISSASTAIGEGLRRRPRPLVVVRSTVVPGTTESVIIPALESKSGLRAGEFGVCVNPEFLREGHALEDSLSPTHIVVGELDRPSGTRLLRLYASFRCPKFRSSLRVAEAVKYATNAFLATKVTFANEVANLSTRLGLDSDEVLRGMALDPRIGPRHLEPGVGFGGACLPKDLRAFISLFRSSGYEPRLFDSVRIVNDGQHLEAVRLLEEEVGPLAGKRIALLGLAFKAGTDDVRGSKAVAIASDLILRGAKVVGYDPRAGEAFGQALSGVELAKSAEEALRGADGCIIHSPWAEISRLGPSAFSRMATPVVIDGRRTWPRDRVPKGLRYRRIG